MHTVLSVLRGAEGYLKSRGVDAPRLSAERLLGKALGVQRLQLYLLHDRPLDEPERATMRELTARRGRHEPLAYLLGSIEFHGRELLVDPDVLIPRPETEGLVDLAIAQAPAGARVVELGTGSGAIAIALALARPDVSVVATEISPGAMRIARENVAKLGLGERIRLVAGSWWEPVAGESFDLLVSNPPYVDPARDDLLAPDVRAFEPRLALFSQPNDPASSYRAILAGAERSLRSGAVVLLETGVEAAAPALALLAAAPFLTQAELRRDLAGLPRYLLARVGAR
jgi:release factor glutamine methyltransferase